MWYPALTQRDVPRMIYGTYLDLTTTDPHLTRLCERLTEYERNVISSELLGVDEAKLTGPQQTALQQFFKQTTPCMLDAPRADGRFPIIIYHTGAGSSFDDITALCTTLASRGYVVIGSAFLKANGSTWNIDGEEGSAADIAFPHQLGRATAQRAARSHRLGRTQRRRTIHRHPPSTNHARAA